MSKTPIEVDALADALIDPSSTTKFEPGPQTRPSSPKAALRRCCAAWQRAYDVKLGELKGAGEAKFHASRAGAEAYRNAMPMLAGYDGIRDFVACVAHGMLIDAFRLDDARQLLYAAQVANGALNHAPKPAPMPARSTTTPSPLPPESTSLSGLP